MDNIGCMALASFEHPRPLPTKTPDPWYVVLVVLDLRRPAN